MTTIDKHLEDALDEAHGLLSPALKKAGWPPKPLPLKEGIALREHLRMLAAQSGNPTRFWEQTADTLALLDPPTSHQPPDDFTGEERPRALAHAAMDLLHLASLEGPLSKDRFDALVSEVELLCLDCEEPDEVRAAVAEQLAVFEPVADDDEG